MPLALSKAPARAFAPILIICRGHVPHFRSTRFEGILSSMDERAVGEGLVAQMVEHGTFNSGVMGSSPIQPTNATDGY